MRDIEKENQLPKKYVTKSGKEVHIYLIDVNKNKFHGVFLDRNNQWVTSTWNRNGQWLDIFESSMDLVI